MHPTPIARYTYSTAMALIDDQTERTLESFRDALTEQLGQALTSIVLFGSATGSHYIEDVSDLNVLIVVESASMQLLETIRTTLRTHKGITIDPLIVTRTEVDRLPDAFPIETADIQAARRVLSGDDLLAGLEVQPEAIRRQLASELLGKTMRLRSVYAQAKKGNDKELRATLGRAISPFGALMRALLHVSDVKFAQLSPPREFLEILAQLEKRFDLEMEGFRSASLVKSGRETPDHTELTAIFEKVLSEAEQLQALSATLEPQETT